jgi:hypothetical protein
MLDRNFPQIRNATEGSSYTSERSNAGQKFPSNQKCDLRELLPSGAAMLDENPPLIQ